MPQAPSATLVSILVGYDYTTVEKNHLLDAVTTSTDGVGSQNVAH
jgi:hypothetical protein